MGFRHLQYVPLTEIILIDFNLSIISSSVLLLLLDLLLTSRAGSLNEKGSALSKLLFLIKYTYTQRFRLGRVTKAQPEFKSD